LQDYRCHNPEDENLNLSASLLFTILLLRLWCSTIIMNSNLWERSLLYLTSGIVQDFGSTDRWKPWEILFCSKILERNKQFKVCSKILNALHQLYTVISIWRTLRNLLPLLK
jgi:hypothetical protein